MVIIFAKILSVFGISLVGFAANKMKWLPMESTKYLSLLLINIASPCLVIYSMSQEVLTDSAIASVIQTAGLMLLALVAATVLSVFAVRIMKVPAADRGVFRTLLVLTNCGFMGYPLSLAVFGAKGLFLMIIANAVFMLYTYSVGVVMLISGRDQKLTAMTAFQSIISIPVVSTVIGLVIFAFGFRIPFLLENFLGTVGGITIPLSMIIIGIQLAESKPAEVLRNRHIFEALILKLVVFPVVLGLLLRLLPIDSFVYSIVIFAMVMPSAAIIPVLSELYGANAKLAAQVVFITTMCSIVTIPAFGMILYNLK